MSHEAHDSHARAVRPSTHLVTTTRYSCAIAPAVARFPADWRLFARGMCPAQSRGMRQGRSHAASGRRAQRFDLRLPVSYRMEHEREWRRGTTESISTTGAAIRAHQSVVPTGPILIAISLPVVPGYLVGRGRIVRTLPPGAHTDEAGFVVAVDRYRIGRRDSLLNAHERSRTPRRRPSTDAQGGLSDVEGRATDAASTSRKDSSALRCLGLRTPLRPF